MTTEIQINKSKDAALDSDGLVVDIRKLIEDARQHVAREYNATHILLCWLIGKKIDENVLKFERADYDERIIELIVTELSVHYGRGFGKRNLLRKLQFSRLFPDKEIVSTLLTQLSRSYFVQKYLFSMHERRSCKAFELMGFLKVDRFMRGCSCTLAKERS